MEIEKAMRQSKAPANGSGGNKPEAVSNVRLKSETSDAKTAAAVEVPNIRLAPEQIEEIHADEYSLTLFYATRIEPMSIADIKRNFPEPEPKKAQSVMDRFVKVGLVHLTESGQFYSNYPENYINYSHYRYDGDLEARKDAKVFRLMKEFTGKKEYWKDKTYFSMDAFYTPEQTRELLDMFLQIKLRAKEYSNENAKKKSTNGLTFRRMKFYDMTLGLALLVSVLFALAAPQAALAGGNDPHIKAALIADRQGTLAIIARAGGGNDPTAAAGGFGFGDRTFNVSDEPWRRSFPTFPPPPPPGGGHDPTGDSGGGGHDPNSGAPSCMFEIENYLYPVQSHSICRLKGLLDFAVRCGDSEAASCSQAKQQIDDLVEIIEHEEN
jgi:hypothetical protein